MRSLLGPVNFLSQTKPMKKKKSSCLGPILQTITHSFTHSGHFYSAPSSPLLPRGAPEHGYCIGVSRRSAQATAGKGLAQGPYVAATKAPMDTSSLSYIIIYDISHMILFSDIASFRNMKVSSSASGPSIKYVTFEGEGVREGVTVCDRGRG